MVSVDVMSDHNRGQRGAKFAEKSMRTGHRFDNDGRGGERRLETIGELLRALQRLNHSYNCVFGDTVQCGCNWMGLSRLSMPMARTVATVHSPSMCVCAIIECTLSPLDPVVMEALAVEVSFYFLMFRP